jgi:hypothetical protein
MFVGGEVEARLTHQPEVKVVSVMVTWRDAFNIVFRLWVASAVLGLVVLPFLVCLGSSTVTAFLSGLAEM